MARFALAREKDGSLVKYETERPSRTGRVKEATEAGRTFITSHSDAAKIDALMARMEDARTK